MKIVLTCLVLLLVATSVRSRPCKPCRLVQCFVAPCSVSSCPNHPTAQCKDDYCGGCFARYYVNNELVEC